MKIKPKIIISIIALAGLKGKDMKSILTVIAFLLLSGCATYKTPNIPQNQMAQIQECELGEVAYIDIKKINGTPIRNYWQEITGSTTNKIENRKFWIDYTRGTETFSVAPEPCRLDLYYSTAFWEGFGEVYFTPVARKKYQIGCITHQAGKWLPSLQIFFYVLDTETGQPVGNIPTELKEEIASSLRKQPKTN